MSAKRIRLLIFWLLLPAILAACSSAPVAKSGPTQGKESGSPAPLGAPSIAAPAAAPMAADQSRAERAPSAPPLQPSASTAAQASALPWDRMIIRTVTLSLVVKDVEANLSSIRDLANGVGGFVTQSNSRYDGEYQLATIVIQVPAERFDTVVDSIRKLAVKVESENGSSQDVTEEYTDLDAQVRNLQATEASLQRLMDRATQMSDIIALQRELTNIRGEIERRQGRMKLLSRRADMSSITVSLRPEGLAKPPQPEPLWRPLETARKAWEASARVLMGIADVGIALIVFFWWLIPLAVLVVYLLRTRGWPRRSGTPA